VFGGAAKAIVDEMLSIKEHPLPAGLNATLRDYQVRGMSSRSNRRLFYGRGSHTSVTLQQREKTRIVHGWNTCVMSVSLLVAGSLCPHAARR
jgi:hypothetical protein